MKICGACDQDLPLERFSKKQWQLRQHRRCKDCIHTNQDLSLVQSPKSQTAGSANEIQSREPEPERAVDGDAPSCFICLCEGPDESRKLLRRDCSCRGGDAGFAHLSCLVGYAKQKSQQWKDGDDINQFRRTWEYCPCCNQCYTNELAVDLATEFATWVRAEYPRDQLRHLEALVLKMETLQNMATRLTLKERKSAKQLAGNIFYLTRQMKPKVTANLMSRVYMAEAVTYNGLGRFNICDGTEDSARAAVNCFEKSRDANRVIGNATGLALAETYISIAKSKYESKKENQDAVVINIGKVYRRRLEECGHDHPSTLIAGVDLAVNLWKADRLLQAERMVAKMIPLCRRVHGPDHRVTIKAEDYLYSWQGRYVMVNYQLEWKNFEFLRYEEDGKECVVRGPITSPRKPDDEITMSVLTNGASLYYPLDTPVVCHGLKVAKHLNGKVGDLRARDDITGRYKVHFEDTSIPPRMIRRENVKVVSELPPRV